MSVLCLQLVSAFVQKSAIADLIIQLFSVSDDSYFALTNQ